ncbi:glutamate-gated chloride channel alpha-like [Homarus americanus]|uniref:glutamate-gated chloride channel alpha-like n=1 Tax=Homarus americanus TaxID=6706 RepID=UPI001C47A766|nr:glutamate-gated chloride channel alpha-like [Homarus americanus]
MEMSLLTGVVVSLLVHTCRGSSEGETLLLGTPKRIRRQATPVDPQVNSSDPQMPQMNGKPDEGTGGCPGSEEFTPGRPRNPTLSSIIPAGYDQYVLPLTKDGGPLPVFISAKVRDIQKIDELNMDLTIEWYIRLYWTDSGLNAPTHLPDNAWLNVAPDIIRYIWLPTTYIDHVKEVTKPTLLLKAESFRMQNNGLIRYSISVTTRISCPMDFSAYPFDSQVCYFKMESYQFTSLQVSYKWYSAEIERAENIASGHYDIDFYSVQQKNVSHSTGHFPTVMVEVVLKRRISYHLMNTFLPSGLFVCVSWLTFLVPVDQIPGRMVLTITTLLTLVSMFAAVRQESPKVSYAKAVDQWMIMCVVFVFCVLVEFTVVLRLYELGRRRASRKKASTAPLNSTAIATHRPTNVLPASVTATTYTNHSVSSPVFMERARNLTSSSEGSSSPGVNKLKKRVWRASLALSRGGGEVGEGRGTWQEEKLRGEIAEYREERDDGGDDDGNDDDDDPGSGGAGVDEVGGPCGTVESTGLPLHLLHGDNSSTTSLGVIIKCYIIIDTLESMSPARHTVTSTSRRIVTSTHPGVRLGALWVDH